MKNKTIKYLTAICFMVVVILSVIDIGTTAFGNGVSAHFDLLYAGFTIGCVLVVIALLTSTPALSTVGFTFSAICEFLTLLSEFRAIIGGWISLLRLIVLIINVVVFVLLMFATLKTKFAKTIGRATAIIAILRLLVIIIRCITEGYGISASTIIWGVSLAVGAVLIGRVYESVFPEEMADRATASIDGERNPSMATMIDDSPVEKILQLKKFLDDGVITQEEFDEKKKQLLGM